MKKLNHALIVPLAMGLVLGALLISGCSHRGKQTRFKNFPSGKTRSVTFDLTDQTFSEMSDREVLDQARDWLLYTTLAGSDYTVEQINQSSYDVPAVRRGYLRSVGNYEYGETRSCYIGDGNVIVLVPADKPNEQPAMLSAAVDQHRKNSGEIPKAVVVFDYKINWDRQAARLSAELARRATLDGAELFSKKYGYRESEINSLTDLQKFLSQVNDISHARLNGNKLIIGGRQASHVGIGIEEIADVWQSEQEIRNKLASVQDSLDQEYKALKARWSNQTYRTESERDAAIEKMQKEADQLDAQQRERLQRTNLVSSSGFSLDPTYDFAALKNYFDGTIVTQIRQMLVGLPGASARQLNQDIKEASDNLGAGKADEFLDLMDKLSSINPVGVDSIMRDVNNNHYAFQAARYDGQLQGTEVGMVLFYTDLMMKLWGWGYDESTPRSIDGFRIKTEMRLSPIYEQDLRTYSNTRIWLGPRAKGFQKADSNKSLSFSRIATRLFSASSNPFRPGVEVETNAMNSDYIGWWDDHYEEVARYEPQYERLNQIMKWSLLISWLNENEQSNQLGFLKDVSVNRSHWFPDWVKQHPELKFHQVENMFHDRGYRGSQTETLPILESKKFSLFGDPRSVHYLSGGVSLGSSREMRKGLAISPQTDIERAARRSNLDYHTSSAAEGVFHTVEGSTFKVTKLSDESTLVTSSAKAVAKLRSNYGELAHVNFDRVVTREGTNLNLNTRAAGADIGDLDIAPTNTGFNVTWSSSDIDAGQAFARRLSSSLDPAQLLASSQDVEMYIKSSDASRYLVKLTDSNRWMDMSFGDSTSALNSGERVANIPDAARVVNLDWLEPANIGAKLKQHGEYLVVTNDATTPRVEIVSAVPAGGTETRNLRVGDTFIPGQVDPSGAAYFKIDDLPQSVLENPLQLTNGLRRDAQIEIIKLENGGYRIDLGANTVNAQSMSGVVDLLSNYKASANVKDESLLLRMDGLTPDEVEGLIKNIDLQLTNAEPRPSILSVFTNPKDSANFKSLLSNYDFARVRVSEPELTTVKAGEHAGASELKVSAEIPAKAAGKPSLLMRIRMLFKTVLSSPRLARIRAAVRGVFRNAVLEDANAERLVIGIIRRLKRIHPEIRNIHGEYKEDSLDLFIIELERKRIRGWSYQQGSWAM